MQIWQRAREMAAQTPPQRNRYVDFLRAASIVVVILGHWLMATVQYVDGEFSSQHLFRLQPATQWLTWIFQVMPIFFIVGGYSNAFSLESARRRGIGYADWLTARLYRLTVPVLTLIFAWSIIAVIMYLSGVDSEDIQLLSKAALIPTWFLAIYIMVVILAPLAYRFWRKFGFAFFWALVALAVLMDLVFFAAQLQWPSWSSYFWVWLAITNLGFAWRDGRLAGPGRLLAISAMALGVLWLLVFFGPYPLAMVGSPGQALSNTTPPKITLIALAAFQFGLLLAFESPMRRHLQKPRLWTAAVMVNGMIMSIYLWHITVMILLIATLYLAGGTGLGLEPVSPAWWLSRPLWMIALLALLLPLALLLSPLERYAPASGRTSPSPLRLIIGAAMICLGIALLAMFGYGGGPLPWFDVLLFGLVVGGAAVCGIIPGSR
jgi:peptidoglycan/LPS O-acetylase OafA/YrhL